MPDRSRARYWASLAPVFAALAVMTTLVVYSPTLYRLFCAATGLAGTTQRASSAPRQAAQAGPAPEFTVRFDSNVANGLPWDFRPKQDEIKVRLGEPAHAVFIAHNNSDKTIVARAVFNVTPYQVAPYFFKIQCFCFTNEKLKPGETAEMPVEFYIDKDLTKDETASLYRDVTLSYTFYPQKDLKPEAVAATRDLARGSKVEQATLDAGKQVGFDNDAPRR